jgi:uncharacterized protein YndB with AHSA1/START domain
MNMAIEVAAPAFVKIDRHMDIDAPPAAVFEAVLAELGPEAQMPDGTSLNMKIEPWPGGRWFRDFGNNTGHLWGHVQVIKPPNLLEIYGPMFMSYAAVNHIQYRIIEQGRGSRLTFTHRGMGEISDEHRKSITMGWEKFMNAIATHALKLASKKS